MVLRTFPKAGKYEAVPSAAPAGLGQAMRYGVLDGGKRLRPLLVLAAAHAVNGQAMQAGDAMQALAFEVLTPEQGVPSALQAQLCSLLARSAGHAGMAGGQAIDLASIGVSLDEQALRDMHHRKTGALLQASVLMGAACGESSAGAWQALADYGDAIGLAFQVVDDILDVTQASETLGKTAGKDINNNKPTYVTVLGLAAARRHARELREKAQAALARSSLVDATWLAELADRVVDRDC